MYDAGRDVLLFPQWQGYAAGDGPARGARAIAAALGAPALHTIDVPAFHELTSHDSDRDVGVQRLGEIVDQARATLGWLEAARPSRLLALCGDCGSDFAPIAWQSARWRDELGVLYLDAHGDVNTPRSSPSGRFHGMILRAALGEGADDLIALHRHPVAIDRLIMAGVRDLDPAEREFLEASGIRPWSPAAIADGRVLAAVQAHRARRWHVHFDLDVLDPRDFPDVTIPTPGGPTLADVMRFLVELVRRCDVVSLSITEHVGGEASARRIVDLLAALDEAGWRPGR